MVDIASPILNIAAEMVDDAEKTRIANENRFRSLTDPEIYGLTVLHPDVAAVAAVVEHLKSLEDEAVKHLQRIMRKHPLGPWVKQSTGVGEKQAARLLAVIGDPYWNTLYDRPRTVSELWAYCGLHVKDGKAVHHQRGQQGNWNDAARMRIWLIAQSCIKTKGQYRNVYEVGRAKYVRSVHASECRRCGPSGHPALPGSPLSLGHQHARATRLVCKEVLKNLWVAAREIHELKEMTA